MSKFFYGFFAHLAFVSLAQDALGRERYIEQVRDGWIDPVYSVPLAIILLIICVFGAIGAKKQ